MKRTMFILAALAAMLFTSCSGLFDTDTVKKSDGISCTINASSFAQLPGARAASSSFTISLTMNNSSTGAAIQSVSTTCAPGGTCTLSFDPVATGTKVVFTGTVAYNGATIGNLSSEEHTITEGVNAVTLTIAAAYPVSVTVDLSSCNITDSGTVTLTLTDTSDNSTIQTISVSGSSTVTCAFDPVKNGTAVNVSGTVTYDGEEVVSLTNSAFTVASGTNAVSLTGTPLQKLIWGVSDNYYYASIQYGGAVKKVFTSADAINKRFYFTSTLDSSGTVYVFYAANSKYYLYSVSMSEPVEITGLTAAAVTDLSLCMLDESAGSFLVSTGYTGVPLIYTVSKSGSGYAATSYTFDGALSNLNTEYPFVMAAVTVNGTCYVFFTYTTAKSADTYSAFVASGMAKCNSEQKYLAVIHTQSINPNTFISTDTSSFRGGVRCSDILVYTNMVYYLFTDLPGSFNGNETSSLAYVSSSFPSLNSRGVMLSVSLSAAVAAAIAQTTPTYTEIGWCDSSRTLYAGGNKCSYYGGQSAEYSENYFAGPQKFIALRPDRITIADYGIYLSSSGDSTTNGTFGEKIGTADFDLSTQSLSFTARSGTHLYGLFGSEALNGSVNYDACCY